MPGDYVYRYDEKAGWYRNRQERNRDGGARRRPPGQYFHVSPFRIPISGHLKPRWCVFPTSFGNPSFAVYLTTSRVRARRIARNIWKDLVVDGGGGYGGTAREPGELGRIQGLWIYRVRPVGPLSSTNRWECTTAFPVRVLEIADTYRLPAGNTCTPPRALTDVEGARLFPDSSRALTRDRMPRDRSFETRWEEFQTSYRRDVDRHRTAFVDAAGPGDEFTDPREQRNDRNLRRRVFDAFHDSPDGEEARGRYLDLVRQEEERIADELAHLRRKQHRKLHPDPRYRRRPFRPGVEEE